jgi:hypothetical protein
MDDKYWEDQFNSFDIDFRKSKDAKEEEQVVEVPPVEESVPLEQN